MIRVEPRPEPPEFDRLVRQPGRRAVAEGVDELPPHWRACLDDLWRAYGGICAYSATYIDRMTGSRSVDHFVAKSGSRDVAYEWSNYRLACGLMNARKRDYSDVIDPFDVEEGWFALDLSMLTVRPGAGLPEAESLRVRETIERLGLNDPECVESRRGWYEAYLETKSFRFLRRMAPFLASELVRQDLVGAAALAGSA